MFTEKGHHYLQSIAVAVGIFVPCLLLAGYCYRLGYITTFGLNPEIISKGLADVIVRAGF